MSETEIWLSTGFKHILDVNGYDHILFVSLLAITYSLKQWKQLLGLITAFTLGHSFSLALSVFDVVKINTLFIEFLIALSILITAVIIYFKNQNHPKRVMLMYCIICFFGLVHGMGFSYLLKAMLPKDESMLMPLLYFNLGLEIGQFAIVALVLLFSVILTRLLHVSDKFLIKSVSVLVGLVSLKMCVERCIVIFNS